MHGPVSGQPSRFLRLPSTWAGSTVRPQSAVDIFKESVFSLSDGFDQTQLNQYNEAISQIKQVQAVKSIKGRSYGANVYLDVTITMKPDLTVKESHDITDQIEKLLQNKFQIFETDIHVEPSD